MAPPLQTLLQSLEQETSIYKELLSLTEEQREHLFARQTDALLEVLDRQSKLLMESRRAEQIRMEALEEVETHLGLSDGPFPLSELISRLDLADAGPMESLRQSLLDTVRLLHEAQQVNTALFESAMDTIRFTLQIFAGDSASAAPASPFHEAARPASSLLVDQHA